jgi:hypothetical protein
MENNTHHQWGAQKPNGEQWCERCDYVKALVSNGYTLRVRYRRHSDTRWSTRTRACMPTETLEEITGLL